MSELCERLHNTVKSAKRYTFNTGFDSIPLNGIYIMFEMGEFAHGADRIVRIGTHTGKNQLLSRIHQHFIKENKNRSIFRKNIGRCLLNGHSYSEKWEYDTTSRKNKEMYLPLLDLEFEKQIETQITQYIQKNLSFAIISINAINNRLLLEKKLISTVSLCSDCKPTPNWFGYTSPLIKIRQSGLWQVQGLYGNTLSTDDIIFIKKALI